MDDKLLKLPPNLIVSFQTAGISLPNGQPMADLFVTVKSKESAPGKPIRLRMTTTMHEALAYSLTEALVSPAEDRIQRLFQKASITSVVTSPGNQEGFVLTLEQTNTSQGHQNPIRMFFAPEQLSGLVDALREALAQHQSRGPRPIQ